MAEQAGNPVVILGKRFIEALLESGVVSPGERVRRVVIDACVDAPTVMYIERYGDTRLLSVAMSLGGAQVTETESPTS